ncbi:RHS repeat-associated core domain-containing protein [Streptomyces fructofermentans]|uniref:RHS repeat-associated core domain-containing protein n=1 Tax=Streptomyces fructofermentans TaxID=152141 RepID=UPI0033DA0027
MLDLEKDPTPGDPVRVKSLARSLHAFADDVQDALRLVKGMAEEDAVLAMVGRTAEVFRDEFSGVPKNLRKLKRSYDLAGDALAAYWPQLERAQALADKALADGRVARADLSSATSRLSSADSWVARAGEEADKYKEDRGAGKDVPKPDEAKVRAATRDAQSARAAHASARSDVASAQSALDAAKKMAADARRMREDAAGEAKRKLDEASDAGIRNRRWYEEVGDWFVDNWDTIVAVCKVVVAVLGVIALIIGGPILGAIVLIAALIVLADTLSKYAKGQASLWDVAFAALDCIPGMKGLTTLGGLAKGLKGLRGGLKGMAAGVRGLGKGARSMLARGQDAFARNARAIMAKMTDPIDLATGKMYLPQTDLDLPGLLPLVLSRRVESGYGAGWWFGPCWASTLDEHLEIDAEGVLYVTEGGQILPYPHPESPDLPVLPAVGDRWPLRRLDDGGYALVRTDTGHTRLFTAPAGGVSRLRQISDRNGHRVTFDHDEYGAPTGVRHSAGQHVRIDTEDGRVTALHLAGAGADGSDVTVKRFGYTDGLLTEDINSSGLALRYRYDERGRVVSWTDRNDSSYSYTYDELDRCVAESGQGGHFSLTLAYDRTLPEFPGHTVTVLTTAEGAVSRFVVNPSCQVVAEIDPLGHTTRTAYDRHHHLTSHTDQLGRTTEYVNDEAGRPLVIRRPDGLETRATYNELGLVTATVLPDGSTWSRTYDERGNGLTLTDPAGATSRFAYDGQGRLTGFTDALGRTTRLTCDRAGLTVEAVDPLGGRTRFERDAFGRPLSETDPLGTRTCWEWTTEGNLLRLVGPDGATESWTYDAEGNCLSHTDAVGARTRYAYGHFDLLTERTGPDGARRRFEYNAQLQLTRVTDAQGLTWDYTYDAAGQLVAESDFDGRTVRYGRDAAGRLASRTTALGEVVRYTRDVLGRTARVEAGGRATDFRYDPAGQLVRALWPDGELTRAYDPVGRLTAETVDGRTLSLAYDAAGQLVERRTPSGARTVYAYDAAGRRTGLSTAGRTVSSEYDAAGRETGRRWGRGVLMSRHPDAAGRPVTRRLTGPRGPVLPDLERTWRADGALVAAGDRSHTLDRAGRVTGVSAPGWTESYAYDESGNQTEAHWPSEHPGADATGPRTYDGTRLLTAGRVRDAHDAAGRLVERRRTRLSRGPDLWRYTWDAQDRLTSVTVPDGTTWHYRHDPFGRRIAKVHLSADGGTVLEETRFTWHEGTTVEQTATSARQAGTQTLTWEYDDGGVAPVSQTDRYGPAGGAAPPSAASAPQDEVDARFHAIVTDLVGTPTELLDEEGATVWRATSTLWGRTTWNADAGAYIPLRFPGQYHDLETGHHYNVHRHYDPETGRYLTTDPLGLMPAPNPVAYVHDPLTWADPLGLSPYAPIRIKPGQQLSGAYKLSPPEMEFVKALMARKPNLNLYRTHGEKFQGDFMAVDMSDPRDLVAFIVDHKMGGGNAGQQLKNAMEAAAHVGITNPAKVITGSGDTPKLLELMSRGRGEWNR